MKKTFSLFVSILHLLYVNACVNWTIISPPIIFGETARLGCKLDNYTPKMTREWIGGPNDVPLVINGVTNYPWKYRETTLNSPFNSILNIFHFSENDVDVDYTCYIGDHKDKHRLQLNGQQFECKDKILQDQNEAGVPMRYPNVKSPEGQRQNQQTPTRTGQKQTTFKTWKHKTTEYQSTMRTPVETRVKSGAPEE